MSNTPGYGPSYDGSCPLPPPIIEMDDGSDPPEPPGIDPSSSAITAEQQKTTAAAGTVLAPDPEYDPRTYQPGAFAEGNYSVSTWVLGADNCADYYDDQGARLFRNHYLRLPFGRLAFLGSSFAEAQVHGKVDCSNDGKGNCVISTCGGTTRTTGGGYNGPGTNEYWDGDMTDKSSKINNNSSCDLNVGSYSAVSINRQFKASVAAKIPVNVQGLPIQADANIVYADNGGVIFGHKLKSDTVVNCKAVGVR
jgi:hypothetical protein